MKHLALILFLAATVISACRSVEHPSGGPPQKQTEKPAQANTDRQVERDAKIEKLIEQLGSDRYREREAAAEELAEIGEHAVAALMKAVDSEDPEVSRRAKLTMSVIARKTGLTWTIYLGKDGTIREEGFNGPEVADFKAALRRWSSIAGYRDTKIAGVKHSMLRLTVNLKDGVTFGTLREKVRKPIEEIKVAHLRLNSGGSSEQIEVWYIPCGTTIHFLALTLAHNEDGFLQARLRGRTLKSKEEIIKYMRDIDKSFDKRRPGDKLGAEIRAADEVYVREVIEYARLLREAGFAGLFVLWPDGLSLEKPIILLEEEVEIEEPRKEK